MKNKRKILSVGLVGFIGFSMIGCDYTQNDLNGGKSDFIFTSEYTANEHWNRIMDRTKERFSRELANGEIINYTVEIVYSIYSHTPTYFMVELEYAEEFETEYDNYVDSTLSGKIRGQTKWKHIIGIIGVEEYWIDQVAYPTFVCGRNPYKVFGYENYKKYYCYFQHAVEIDGKLLRIYGGGSNDIPPEFTQKEDSRREYFLNIEDEKQIKNEEYYFLISRY